MKKLYFICGSQDLYGREVLNQVAKDTKEMVAYLNEQVKDIIAIEYLGVVEDANGCEDYFLKVASDKDCVGVITWMHTFSPSKMWIRGLKSLQKPMLHLHTQYNERLPYKTIDMDFMNLNQAAHGDREFGFMCTRLGVKREVVAGYYKNESVIKKIRNFAEVAIALDFSKHLKVAMFGNNMRDVGVTDGDRVESEIVYGWNVNYYGVGDLVDIIDSLTEEEIKTKVDEYLNKYELCTNNLKAVTEQAKYDIAFNKFIEKEHVGALTDTFQDLHGLDELPGLAVQEVMAKGIGFGPEGDYKTSALMAVLCKMLEHRKGATAFMEDYTYDLLEGQETELASHMLEVCPCFADKKPRIEVHPLGSGGKDAPARLVFDGISGDALAVSMIDLGDHFRLVVANIELIKKPEATPNLPVASLLYKLKPNFAEATEKWIEAGGAHHAVVSTSLTIEDIKMFAKFTNTEIVIIG